MEDKKISTCVTEQEMAELDRRYRSEGYLPVDFDIHKSVLIYQHTSIPCTEEANQVFLALFNKMVQLCKEDSK